MKFLLFFLLLVSSFAQTRLVPSQVHWGQVDESFYRQCFFTTPTDSTKSVYGGYLWFPNQTHTTSSSATIPTTDVQLSQIKGYGLSVSGDGKTLIVQGMWSTWTITSVNQAIVGDIELRFATATPNLYLRGGLDYPDLSMIPGGWGMTREDPTMPTSMYPIGPLATAHLENGIFTMIPSTIVFHNACELWGVGPFPNIAPFPPTN